MNHCFDLITHFDHVCPNTFLTHYAKEESCVFTIHISGRLYISNATWDDLQFSVLTTKVPEWQERDPLNGDGVKVTLAIPTLTIFLWLYVLTCVWLCCCFVYSCISKSKASNEVQCFITTTEMFIFEGTKNHANQLGLKN